MARIIHDVLFMVMGLYVSIAGAVEHSILAIAFGFACIGIARVGNPEPYR